MAVAGIRNNTGPVVTGDRLELVRENQFVESHCAPIIGSNPLSMYQRCTSLVWISATVVVVFLFNKPKPRLCLFLYYLSLILNGSVGSR